MTRLTIALALGLAASGAAYAACPVGTTSVCDSGCDDNDLANATDSASNNDVICIEGTYTHTGGEVQVHGKTLTIETDGAGTATVERGGGVHIDVDSGGTLIVRDLVVDGTGGSGRGVVVAGNMTATNLTIRAFDSGSTDGAGLAVEGGAVTCTDCIIDNNSTNNDGANIFVDGGGDLGLVGGTIRDGSADEGAGIFVDGSFLDVDGTTFDQNAATNGDGGAILLTGGSSARIDHAWFTANTATANGAGIYVNGPDNIDVLRSIFCNNAASGDGGGVYFRASSDSEVRGSIFIDNTATNKGGGIYSHDQTVHVTNSTFSANDSSGSDGNGVHGRQSGGTVQSVVFLDHPDTAARDEGGGGSNQVYSHNLLFGNTANVLDNATASAGAGDLINVDPGMSHSGTCNPGKLRHPAASAVVGTGNPALGDNPDATPNTMGAFGGPFAIDYDFDGDGYSSLVDCDEDDPAVHPGATEIPSDGIDNDCNGSDFQDNDMDGYEAVVDCNDNDFFINPGVAEIPGDGIDQDCDLVDDCFIDADSDGYGVGVAQGSSLDCDSEAGFSSVGGDCDDLPEGQNIYPGAYDVPGNGVDEDCDFVDDCFIDGDNDGYGDGVTTGTTLNCDGELNRASNDGDCDDGDNDRFPTNPEEIADGVDQDCDGEELCYRDNDGDDVGQANTIVSVDLDCADNNEATVAGDCNDGDNTIFPDAPEGIADGTDQDCDGQELCYFDSDNDGYGTPTTILSADLDCDDNTESYNDEDCADGNPGIHPGGTDVPGNALDEDCNDRLMCWLDNDNDGSFGTQFSGESPNLSCNPGAGFAFDVNADDCDDGDSARYPGATELVGSGVDEDCDGQELCYVDVDSDGYGVDVGTTTLSGSMTCSVAGVSDTRDDCNDGVAAINPGAIEVALDFVDQDCDRRELCAQDADNDTFGSAIQAPVIGPVGAIDCVGYMVSPNQDDCDDGDGAIHPDAAEQTATAGDQDCDGLERCYEDLDDDGFGTPITVTSSNLDCVGPNISSVDTDCLDTDDTFYPGAPEIPGDGADQDCSGADLVQCYQDLDLDGVGTPTLVPDPTGLCVAAGFSNRATDCDDSRADVNPDVTPQADTCDGVDNDCAQQLLCPGGDDGDGDGLCLDEETTILGTDDCRVDTDGDGWTDLEEAYDPFGVDPALADTDGDGVDDGAEWPRVTVPGDSPKPDLDADGVPDVVDVDDDGDGFESVLEGGAEVDRDGDGIADREDTDDDNDGILTIDELDADTDGDGNDNRIDSDDDGDGWETAYENVIGSAYLSIDSDSDGRLDPVEGDWEGVVPAVGTAVNCAQLALDVDPGLFTIGDMNSLMRDFDGDGLHDLIDGDDDGDGHITLLEGNDDLDGDGCPNSLDLDSDGDGKPDSMESISADSDFDSIPDLLDSDDNDGGLVDSDGDLVLTIDEVNGTLSLDPDTSCAESYLSANPYADAAEVLLACDDGSGDPSIATSSGDLAIDGLELGPAPDFDEIDRDGDGVVDWKDTDDDDDGVPTEMEVGFGCGAGLDASVVKLTVKDTTAAWLQCVGPKVEEVTYQRLSLVGTPGKNEVAYRDTDGDGTYDFQDADDDGDGLPTALEIEDGIDGDRDADGIPDYLDELDEDGPAGDLDADGIPNEIEDYFGLDTTNDDTDGDGIHDGDEFGDDGSEPQDSDGDGTYDVFDEDDDGDGVDTIDEGRGDTDDDGVPDYLDEDSDGDGIDDGDEFGLDDDCDGDPDHVDAILNEGLCDQAAFDPGYYERQECSCGATTAAGWLGGWLGLGLGWVVRRR